MELANKWKLLAVIGNFWDIHGRPWQPCWQTLELTCNLAQGASSGWAHTNQEDNGSWVHCMQPPARQDILCWSNITSADYNECHNTTCGQ